MGNNAKILWHNRIPETAVVVTSSGALTNYPASNLKVQQRSEVWRSRIDPAKKLWVSVDFTGAGLNDMTASGTYSGSSEEVLYRVEIDGIGTPNTFKWSDTGGVSFNATAVAITGSAQTLNNGVSVTFAATTGHTLTNRWDFKAGEAWVQFDLGQTRRLAAFASVFDEFRMTTSGKIRHRASANSDMSSPLVDVTIDAWEALFGADERPDGADSEIVTVDGLPQTEVITLLPKPLRYTLFADVSARYVRFNYRDASSTNTFIEVAYAFAATYYETLLNYSYGRATGRMEEARIDESGSGQLWMDRLYQRFRSEVVFEYQGEAQAVGFWAFIQSFLGISKEAIIVLDDTSQAKKFWYTYYCHIANVDLIVNTHFGRYEVRLNLEELI